MNIYTQVFLGFLLLSTSGCYDVTSKPRANEYYPATTSATPISTITPDRK